MELMKVTLFPDAIERFERIYYPDLVRKGRLDSSDEIKQVYFEFLTKNQDLAIELRVNQNDLELTFQTYGSAVVGGELRTITFTLPIPEELIFETIHDSRIGLGYCVQCHREFPITTGCTHTKCIYGKCQPVNFIPFLDKEGKKMFRGLNHYKHFSEWNPDEFIPHSPEIMKKNRERAREYNTEMEKWNNPHLPFRYKEF